MLIKLIQFPTTLFHSKKDKHSDKPEMQESS
jgi:hypothetical protein